MSIYKAILQTVVLYIYSKIARSTGPSCNGVRARARAKARFWEGWCSLSCQPRYQLFSNHVMFMGTVYGSSHHRLVPFYIIVTFLRLKFLQIILEQIHKNSTIGHELGRLEPSLLILKNTKPKKEPSLWFGIHEISKIYGRINIGQPTELNTNEWVSFLRKKKVFFPRKEIITWTATSRSVSSVKWRIPQSPPNRQT